MIRMLSPTEADAERLNWLERMHATVYRAGTGTHWVVVDETAKTRAGQLGATLREAIDAAVIARG